MISTTTTSILNSTATTSTLNSMMTAVLVAFGVVPPLDDECPSNPSARVTVELDAPLGDRVVLDGLAIPPSPIDPD